MATAADAIREGIITAEAAFCGLTSDDVAKLVANGYGDLPLIVKMRASYDAIQRMTAAQLLNAPGEIADIVRNVYIAGAAQR